MGYEDNRQYRRFPNPGWAWPGGSLDQLIYAAVAPDHEKALITFRAWLSETDIDDVGFREHRLLAAIAGRFGKNLRDHAEFPRLVGLQRMLWTKSRMTLAESLPVLISLTEHDIPVMLLKGGVRLALRPEDQKSRISHDLDILVPSSHFRQALKIFGASDWHGASGESRICLDTRHKYLRAMNFFSGRTGDIDLHQWAYGAAQPIQGAENSLWKNAENTTFFDVPVFVPSVADRVGLAIYHSGRDAHSHSDWMVDCAQYLKDPALDWARLHDILVETKTVVPAQVAISYLHIRAGIPMPNDFISELLGPGKTDRLMSVSEVLQAKPRNDWNALSKLARGIAKQTRLTKNHLGIPKRLLISGRSLNGTGSAKGDFQSISFLKETHSGQYRFDLEIEVEQAGIARRFEYELNTEKRHLTRLKVHHIRPRNGLVRFKFTGLLKLTDDDVGLWLEARPGRHLRGGEPKEVSERYSAVPFQVVSFRLFVGVG